ncbi:MAG: hypothetical protein ABSE17_01210 [Candidatus Levyibacteriota bacterium]
MKITKQKLLTFFLLCGILLIALFARTYQLSSVPNGFHIDEAIIADNAYSIMHTGRDTDNNFLPLQTEVFGDYNPTGYAYLAILPIRFLGLTITAARSVGAILGVFAVLAVFFLAYSIFERINLSLLTSLFIALSPWDIVLSRSTEETAASLVFIVLGFACLIWSIKKQKIRYLLLATTSLFISYFMYFTPRLFVPLLFLAFFIPIKYWYEKRKTIFTKIFIGCFLFIGITAFLLVVVVKGGVSRANQISIFSFPETRLVMEEQIREDGVQHVSLLSTRVFHNKILDYSLTYTSNYLSYFTGEFLFIKGGLPIWFNVPEMGLIYLVELPFIIFGLYNVFREKRKWGFILFLWLLLSPVVASFTVDDTPNIRRSLVMVPAIEMFAAYGVIAAFEKVKNKLRWLIVFVFIILFSLNSLYFFHEYFIHSPIHQNWYRDEGFDKVMALVKKNYQNYDKIVVSKSSGGNYPLVLFYMQYDPSLYLQEGHTKDKNDTGFGKFFFVNTACPSEDKDPNVPKVNKIMYIDDGKCRDYKALTVLKHTYILHLDGTKAFRIVYE